MDTRFNHFVALLHGIKWEYRKSSEYTLSKDIKLCKFKGSYAEEIYLKLCKEYKFDDGDPFDYETYLIIGPRSDPKHAPHEQGPDSTISRLCNVISLTLSIPISWYRIIAVTKDLKYSGFTDDISLTYTAEHLDHYSKITLKSLNTIKNLWMSDCKLRKDYKKNSRIINSLDYYFYAWRAWNIDQTCINLAIVLETLFSPSSNTELSHRIAYNASKFMGNKKIIRKHIYDKIRDYYNLRSQIVHGEQPKFQLLIDSTPKILYFCTCVIKRILLDKHLIATFNNNKKRQELFNEWLFE